jgi:putative protease
MADTIFIQINPQYIHYINQIMEGYEYLGVVSTVNRAEGILTIRVTPDTYREVRDILEQLPIPFAYVSMD